MKNYYFTNDQIENRVLADCNRARLEEHRQCDYCHLCFDCKAYAERTGKSLCKFLDNYKKKERKENEKRRNVY